MRRIQGPEELELHPKVSSPLWSPHDHRSSFQEIKTTRRESPRSPEFLPRNKDDATRVHTITTTLLIDLAIDLEKVCTWDDP
ncbi:hypothetical protein NDU88_007540 [Pleurodeles waltl]|uniref:Uncharacterized protein n=1 Tax=Pleurodeles waltl TaxID=8319 RepID=A0AAV7VSS8_PLEWA|nr:hypothetical protein NDU88_007540 [Pleurodeles waltl]